MSAPDGSEPASHTAGSSLYTAQGNPSAPRPCQMAIDKSESGNERERAIAKRKNRERVYSICIRKECVLYVHMS